MRTLAAIAFCATALMAVPVHAATVQYLGSDGANDGSHLVGPYRLKIDGMDRLAMCYDFNHDVSGGQIWDAELYVLDQFPQAYYGTETNAMDRYRDAAWLLTQLLSAVSTEDRIAIQHAAWSLFAPGAPSEGAARWLAAASKAHSNGYPGIDFTDYRVVNSKPGASQVQGFLVAGFAAAPVPEPATFALVAVSLLTLGLARRVERKQKK